MVVVGAVVGEEMVVLVDVGSVGVVVVAGVVVGSVVVVTGAAVELTGKLVYGKVVVAPSPAGIKAPRSPSSGPKPGSVGRGAVPRACEFSEIKLK